MLRESIDKSQVVDVVGEEMDAEAGTYVVRLRVRRGKRAAWVDLIRRLLEEAQAHEPFELEVRKTYVWNDGKDCLSYQWVLVVWGDLEWIVSALGDIFYTTEAPAPRQHKAVRASRAVPGAPTTPAVRTHVVSRDVRLMDDGSSTHRVRVRLPHGRVGRYSGDPHEIVNLRTRTKKFKARAGGVGSFSYRPVSKE